MNQPVVEMPNADIFERALCNKLDETKGREIINKARERYNDLYAERERHSNRALRKHQKENILLGN